MTQAADKACIRCGKGMDHRRGSRPVDRSVCLSCRREARRDGGTPVRVCSVAGCERQHRSRGLCHAHYERQRLGAQVPAVAQCDDCQSTYQPRHARQRFCSTLCRGRHRDRTRLRAHSKHRGMVTVRDGGICQLCGEPVDLTATFPDRMSPTLDHVLPKSLGGTDEPTNLRLAHLTCNSSRQARIETVGKI